MSENLTQTQTEELKARVDEVLEALRDRARALIAAIAAHAEARRRAELLEKTREQEEAYRSARSVYRVAEANLEMARVAWALEKEALRALAALLSREA